MLSPAKQWAAQSICVPTWREKKKKKNSVCFWTTWSILSANRFKALETTCTKLCWIGIKETQIQCFHPTECILLQLSDNTLVLSLSDYIKKVSKALALPTGTRLQREQTASPKHVFSPVTNNYYFFLKAPRGCDQGLSPPWSQVLVHPKE